MTKATDALLKDHKMIRKILEGFALDHPRFPEILKTLERVVLAHAWFEDVIFLPAFEKAPLLQKPFVHEINQEHKDIEFLLKLLRRTPLVQKKELDAAFLQLTTLLKTHFEKEEDALFPLAERILDNEGLNQLGAEMERRKKEAAHNIN